MVDNFDNLEIPIVVKFIDQNKMFNVNIDPD